MREIYIRNKKIHFIAKAIDRIDAMSNTQNGLQCRSTDKQINVMIILMGITNVMSYYGPSKSIQSVSEWNFLFRSYFALSFHSPVNSHDLHLQQSSQMSVSSYIENNFQRIPFGEHKTHTHKHVHAHKNRIAHSLMRMNERKFHFIPFLAKRKRSGRNKKKKTRRRRKRKKSFQHTDAMQPPTTDDADDDLARCHTEEIKCLDVKSIE